MVDDVARMCERAAAMGVGSARLRDPAFHAAVNRYLDLLMQWNARVNLTAVRDRQEALERHVLDSLVVAGQVPEQAGSLVDVGSGGGFPGAVIALLRPDLAVTLVESLHKKCAFLETLRRELPLPGTQVACERAESVVAAGRRFDCAVSRATLALPEWLALGRQLVVPGGVVLGMEGGGTYDLPPGASRIPYELGGAQRAIVLFHVEHA